MPRMLVQRLNMASCLELELKMPLNACFLLGGWQRREGHTVRPVPVPYRCLVFLVVHLGFAAHGCPIV